MLQTGNATTPSLHFAASHTDSTTRMLRPCPLCCSKRGSGVLVAAAAMVSLLGLPFLSCFEPSIIAAS
ncbi:hypothetical protein Taro_018074 [Colocasia esculenta]|uniref:Uncharacterized protein n=1 Tax=Colocasia esculenta TaxID=4460 RepID=A0A843UY21_COLES|nr:hypothetical protein [Colocasia esculenta]